MGVSEFCYLRDFNAILPSNERWRVNGFGAASIELVDWVESLELQDLPLLGSNFTFLDGGSGCARSKLDHVLVNDMHSGWSDRVVQKVVFKFTLDHLLVVLTSETKLSGPWPF